LGAVAERHWSITQIVEHCLPACHGGFAKFSLECLGNVAVATHPLSHTVSFPPMSATRTAHSKFKKTLQGLRPEPRAHLAYYVIYIETQDVNMGIRKRSILTAFAIMLIAAAPAWSQSLLKTLDPDNDGTVDLAEAKSAASKLFDKLDRDHDGTLDKRELRGRLNAKDFAAGDPDNDGTLDKNEFLALIEKRFKAADPDNDRTIDSKELKSSAGRSLALLLK
jgi:Ca2+-binding EF-hand superfamily protein